MENTPPATHTARTNVSSFIAPATIAGVPNTPAPTISPTIMVQASNTVSDALGCAADCVLLLEGSLILFRLRLVLRAGEFAALHAFGGPRGLPGPGTFADAHRAGDGFTAHQSVEFVTLQFRATTSGE